MASPQSHNSFDPSRPDFSPYGLTCVDWTPTPMLRPDHHNEMEINLVRSGSLTYLLGGGKSVVEAGRLAIFWAAIPHQLLEYSTRESYLVATIPFSWFLQFRLPETFIQRLLQGELLSEPDTKHSVQDEALFAQWVADLNSGSKDVRDVVILEMEARLRRLAHNVPGQRGATRKRAKPGKGVVLSRGTGGLNKVEEMACLIAQRYREDLTVEQIGEAVGLHPNYAMGLFKRTFGTTLIDYLTHHRISHAQRLLATSNEKILQVALDSGFNSISRFNAAFRQACGCSPREYRKAHGG